MADLSGNELFPNSIVGLDGNNYPAATTIQKSTAAVAGAGSSFASSQLDVTASTTYATIPGMTQVLKSGTYKFSALVGGTSVALGGMQLAFTYTNMTVTSLLAIGKLFFATSSVATNLITSTSGQATIVSSTVASKIAELDGTISTSSGGTITLQFSQASSSAGTSSAYAGSVMQFVKIGS